ncbi:MAG: hypothetical protein ABIQ95_06860 [Bdellovibrionia bacterium]
MFHKRYEIAAIIAMGLTSVNCYSGVPQAKAASKNKTGQAGSVSGKSIGPTCGSEDEDNLCLALKYVVYKDGDGEGVVDSDQVIDNLKEINNVWGQCKIGFQIDEFDATAPEDVGFSFDPANDDELFGIRSQYNDESTLLLVTTGDWNRTGTLGNTFANAWTNLPADFPFGVVLEKSVGTFPLIIAHEIGHYLDLLHVDDGSNLLNPIIYPESNVLGEDQCQTARATALSSWKKMLR